MSSERCAHHSTNMPTCHHAKTCSKHAQGSCQRFAQDKDNSRFQGKENEGTLKETKFPHLVEFRCNEQCQRSPNKLYCALPRSLYGASTSFKTSHESWEVGCRILTASFCRPRQSCQVHEPALLGKVKSTKISDSEKHKELWQ